MDLNQMAYATLSCDQDLECRDPYMITTLACQ